MVLRLWAPPSHTFLARNWNRARSGCCLTAFNVANRTLVSTPLRTASVIWVMGGSIEPLGRRRNQEIYGVFAVRLRSFFDPEGRGRRTEAVVSQQSDGREQATRRVEL